MVIPQSSKALIYKIDIESLKTYDNYKITLNSTTDCLTTFKCITIQLDFLINIEEQFGGNLQR